MAHVIVYRKSNGLAVDEFNCIPHITEHIKKYTYTKANKQDCFMFSFPSGSSCWYAHSDFEYRFIGGF